MIKRLSYLILGSLVGINAHAIPAVNCCGAIVGKAGTYGPTGGFVITSGMTSVLVCGQLLGPGSRLTMEPGQCTASLPENLPHVAALNTENLSNNAPGTPADLPRTSPDSFSEGAGAAG